jgi:hypothetical protein
MGFYPVPFPRSAILTSTSFLRGIARMKIIANDVFPKVMLEVQSLIAFSLA